jgi:hypothetical protein
LGGLIDTFSCEDLAAQEHQDLDVLGRVFEYMVSQFASAEGKQGGELYTPRSIVKLLVDMLEPFNGRVFDPAFMCKSVSHETFGVGASRVGLPQGPGIDSLAARPVQATIDRYQGVVGPRLSRVDGDFVSR